MRREFFYSVAIKSFLRHAVGSVTDQRTDGGSVRGWFSVALRADSGPNFAESGHLWLTSGSVICAHEQRTVCNRVYASRAAQTAWTSDPPRWERYRVCKQEPPERKPPSRHLLPNSNPNAITNVTWARSPPKPNQFLLLVTHRTSPKKFKSNFVNNLLNYPANRHVQTDAWWNEGPSVEVRTCRTNNLFRKVQLGARRFFSQGRQMMSRGSKGRGGVRFWGGGLRSIIY